MQPKAAVIQDLCGAGKCSLTIALPVLSAAGISCSVLPTAVFSTHTGGFAAVHCRELTGDLLPIARHWKREGLTFDALYTGYLCSPEQVGAARTVLDLFRGPEQTGPLCLVDPAMGDDGRLYRLCTPALVEQMKGLCAGADIIVPNVTEAAFMLGESYREPPYTKTHIEQLLRGLAGLTRRFAVLTGVSFSPDELGCAWIDRRDGIPAFLMGKREEGTYHGTGDLFSSALLGGLLNGRPLPSALDSASRLVGEAVRRTREAGTAERDGLQFESCLADFGGGIRETSVKHWETV